VIKGETNEPGRPLVDQKMEVFGKSGSKMVAKKKKGISRNPLSY
jgi:hypothetical protein